MTSRSFVSKDPKCIQFVCYNFAKAAERQSFPWNVHCEPTSTHKSSFSISSFPGKEKTSGEMQQWQQQLHPLAVQWPNNVQIQEERPPANVMAKIRRRQLRTLFFYSLPLDRHCFQGLGFLSGIA